MSFFPPRNHPGYHITFNPGLPRLFWTVTISQIFLVFDVLDSFEEYQSGIL